MKLFAFLLLATLLMALVAYDFRAYKNSKQTISNIKEVTRDSSVTNQQHNFISNFYSNSGLSDKKTTNDSTSSLNIPQSHDLNLQGGVAASWDSIGELSSLQQQIDTSISQLHSIIAKDNPDTSSITNSSPIDNQSLLANLEKKQNLNTSFVEYMSDDLLGKMPAIVGLNIAALLTMFVAGFAIVYRENLQQANKNTQRGELLDKRDEEVLQSRKMMLSIMEDLSEEKVTAEHLSTMLEDSNKSIKLKNEEMEQFIYTVSHDLKSPLVSIGGFSSILRRELTEELTEKQAHYLSRIQRNVTDMESMLGDLLELSRISKQEFERKIVDTDSHVANLLDSFERELDDIGCVVDVNTPLHEVYANERLLRQCLSNLISNAITYRSKDKPPEIAISSSQDSTHVILTVKDNGIGIDSKYHDLVFRIFEHLDSSVGTGVGLTIVKTVLEKHGGSVLLESELGLGCTFHLKFPNEEYIRKVA